jgi:hypothetical protein
MAFVGFLRRKVMDTEIGEWEGDIAGDIRSVGESLC